MNNSVIKSLFWKFTERMSSQLVTFVVSIVLARLLTPDDYGTIALITVFISLSDVLITSGFSSALIQKKNADNLDFSSVFFFNIIFSAVIYAILYFSSPSIAEFYKIPVLCDALRVLALVIPIMAVNSVQQAYVSRNMMFKKFCYSTLSGSIFSGIVGIAMAYAGMGIWALVAQYIVNNAANMLVLFFVLDWHPSLVFSLERMKGLFSYGWKLLCSGLLSTGYTQLTSLLIGKLYTSSDLGFYNRGQQYPQLVVSNINSTISAVLFPVLAQKQGDFSEVKRYTRRAVQVSSYVMWPMMAGLAVCAEPLVRLMLTEKWLPCVPYLWIACFTFGIWPIHTANLEALKAIGRSDLFFKLEIIKKAVGLTVLLLTIPHGVMVMALSAVFTSIISAFVNAYPNTKILGYTYQEQLSDMLPSMFWSALMIIILLPIQKWIPNDFVCIAVSVLIGAVYYVAVSILTKSSAFAFLWQMMKKKK